MFRLPLEHRRALISLGLPADKVDAVDAAVSVGKFDWTQLLAILGPVLIALLESLLKPPAPTPAP